MIYLSIKKIVDITMRTLTEEKVNLKQIKSPLNYIGGKTKILNQLVPLFPERINKFIDLFAGGCNVGVNINANEIHFNDNLKYLIEMYKVLKYSPLETTLGYIHNQIKIFQLSLSNEAGYKNLRQYYNIYKNPLDLFVLIAYSFNHQIRFNNNHEFNNPFGRERSSFNETMKNNLILFIHRLQQLNTCFSSSNFDDFDLSIVDENDFIYCDPPYLITTGTYNDGKRGFTGWNEEQEKILLDILEELHQRNIKFALSNVLIHKGKENIILNEWVKKNSFIKINYINANYSNSNYQTIIRGKNESIEVLLTNYEPLRSCLKIKD
jgi:DNA adenine methylase